MVDGEVCVAARRRGACSVAGVRAGLQALGDHDDAEIGHGGGMAEPTQRALAEQAESLRDRSRAGDPRIDDDDGSTCATPERALKFFRALPDDALESAVSGDDADRRLAACWRLMLRGQALPAGAPSDGMRLMLLVNLASVQALELLEVLVQLDPGAAVRASAVTLMWRVARDRDRVVDLLVARLEAEQAPAVLVALLSLTPPLPPERVRTLVRTYVDHRATDVRTAAERLWHAIGGTDLPPHLERRAAIVRAAAGSLWNRHADDDAALAEAIRRERDPEVRRAALDLWASSDAHATLLPWLAVPPLRDDGLAALAASGRRYRFDEVAHVIDDAAPDCALRLAQGPFPPGSRGRLLALTGALDPTRPTVAPTELLRCLSAARWDASETAEDREHSDALRRRAESVRARLQAIEDAKGPADPEDWEDEEYGDDDWVDADDETRALWSEESALLRIIAAHAGE